MKTKNTFFPILFGFFLLFAASAWFVKTESKPFFHIPNNIKLLADTSYVARFTLNHTTYYTTILGENPPILFRDSLEINLPEKVQQISPLNLEGHEIIEFSVNEKWGLINPVNHQIIPAIFDYFGILDNQIIGIKNYQAFKIDASSFKSESIKLSSNTDFYESYQPILLHQVDKEDLIDFIKTPSFLAAQFGITEVELSNQSVILYNKTLRKLDLSDNIKIAVKKIFYTVNDGRGEVTNYYLNNSSNPISKYESVEKGYYPFTMYCFKTINDSVFRYANLIAQSVFSSNTESESDSLKKLGELKITYFKWEEDGISVLGNRNLLVHCERISDKFLSLPKYFEYKKRYFKQEGLSLEELIELRSELLKTQQTRALLGIESENLSILSRAIETRKKKPLPYIPISKQDKPIITFFLNQQKAEITQNE